MDDVTIARDIIVKKQAFAEIHDLTAEMVSGYLSNPYDGLLGLAFPADSDTGATVFFENVIQQDLLDQPVLRNLQDSLVER